MTTDLKPADEDITLFWRRPVLETVLGLKRSAIYELMKQEDNPDPLPQPYQLGPKAVGWKPAEIKAWAERRQKVKPTAKAA